MTNNQPSSMLSVLRKATIALLLLLITFAFSLWLVDPVRSANSDFFTFWLAARLVLEGYNPYLTDIWVGGHHLYGATWIPNQTFIYPLPVALLFLPLGALPLYWAYLLWVWILEGLILLSLCHLLKVWPLRFAQAYALLFVLVLLFFRPTWLALAHGQLSGFILAVLAWMTFLWSQGKYRQSAWLLPFLFFKPNLGAPLAVVLLLYLFRKDRTSILVSLLSGLFLVLLGMLVNWRWIGEFWTAGETKMLGALGSSPTIWGMATVVCDFQSDCARWLGGGTILLLSLLFLIWFWKRSEHLSPLQVTSLAVCFTLLSTPYTWTYDQILLLVPLTTLTLSLVLQGVRFMKIALLLLGIDLLAFFLALITMGMTYEIPYVTLPLLVTLLLGWSSFRKGKIAGTEEAAA